MEATILRSEVLKQMKSGEPFDLEFVSADVKRGTGGEAIKLVQHVRLTDLFEERPVRTWEKGKKGKGEQRSGQNIILVCNPANKKAHPVPVHIELMTFFNDKRIING